MDFGRSTQAKAWQYDADSLAMCKEEASTIQSTTEGRSGSKPRVRKYACGFPGKHHAAEKSLGKHDRGVDGLQCSGTKMDSRDQETLVHFHAHQIQRLVGPNAIFPELQRSASVLSTAIMLFRRFYLSNSVVDFHPRDLAAASALLAVKVDCDRSLKIGLLAYATSAVNLKASKSPLCGEELRAVSIREIEEAERTLLEGLDFRLHCHHPYGAIKVLTAELASNLADSLDRTSKNESEGFGYRSPRSVFKQCHSSESLNTLCERALAVAQSALIYSDVNFLFPPGKIAFAAVAVALEGPGHSGRLGHMMRNYLRERFQPKTGEELSIYETDVMSIIERIGECTAIDLRKFTSSSHRRSRATTQNQAAEVRRAFSLAAQYRRLSGEVSKLALQPTNSDRSRKRIQREEECLSPHRPYKAARVTPNPTSRF